MIPSNLLLQAYQSGVFPMAIGNGEIGWFSPEPRAVIPLDDFHVPHGLRRRLRKGEFEIRINHAFENVMQACAERRETWINGEILESYCNLHRMGFAHSVEAWSGGELSGGLYGVAIGSAFFGESMFHRATDASKVALHALVERLRTRGFMLLEVQWMTSHLRQFGAVEMSRHAYLKLLRQCMARRCVFA